MKLTNARYTHCVGYATQHDRMYVYVYRKAFFSVTPSWVSVVHLCCIFVHFKWNFFQWSVLNKQTLKIVDMIVIFARVCYRNNDDRYVWATNPLVNTTYLRYTIMDVWRFDRFLFMSEPHFSCILWNAQVINHFLCVFS